MRSLCLHFLLDMAALFSLSKLFAGISFSNAAAVFWAALVLGLINYLLMPVIRFFTWPLNFLTLGIFPLVCNAFILIGISHLVPGFMVSNFVTALLGSIVLAFISYLLNLLFA